ncbi:MAG TPA: hypothetical protein VMR33_19445 [Candidatus Baltobacteraceae bacterium]|jgi:hypothetical protein|nr:hypothetical protein [Candidatus Baltobacteraceae bacterium]
MANITDIERLNYYEGEYLGAVDFAAEQEYLRDMRRRHNIGQHTWGIVTGLDLVQVAASGASGSPAPVDVYIQPGMAVDGFGREIVMFSETQLQTSLLAAYYNPSPQAQPQPIYVWIAYQQQFLQPSTDACTSQNTANPYGRIQESFQLVVTTSATPSPPPNDPLVVDGTDLTPPPEPSTLASSSTSSSTTTPTLGPNSIVLPYDGSIPYQEFATDDTTVNWLIPLGQVQWDPYNQVFLTTAPKLAKSGRQYAGNVSATVYAPTGSLTIQDRFAPYPLPSDPTDAHYHGVRVEVLGSLKVDRVIRALHGAWIYEHWHLNFKNSGGQDGDTALWIRRVSHATGGADLHIHIGDGTKYKTTPQRLTIGYGSADGSSDTPVMDVCADGSVDIYAGPLNFGTGMNYGLGIQANTLFFRSQANFDWFVGGSYSTTQDAPGTGGSLVMQLDATGDLWMNGSLNIDRGNQNGGSVSPGPSLTFGLNNGNQCGEGIASQRQGAGNTFGLDFYTNYAARMSITQNGLVGIGTTTPQQNLSVNGGLNIDQKDANNGSLQYNQQGPWLSFGSTSGEGIASKRTAGGNQHGLDFYTGSTNQMSITSNGLVGIGTSGPDAQLQISGGQWDLTGTEGDFKIGNDTYRMKFGVALGGAGAGDGRIRAAGGTNRLMIGSGTDDTLTISNGMVGIENTSPQSTLDVNGSINAGGTVTVGGVQLTGGTINIGLETVPYLTVTGYLNPTAGKTGYVTEHFVNRNGEKLERGDVVVLQSKPASQYHGLNNQIPLVEVQRTDQAHEPGVCGIVDQPGVSAAQIPYLKQAQLGDVQVGLMVTLGAYAYCKVDADIGPIKPGDLLTTSPSLGYAQRVESRARSSLGTVIGKAMGALDKGKGTIPVFVVHQ